MMHPHSEVLGLDSVFQDQGKENRSESHTMKVELENKEMERLPSSKESKYYVLIME